MIARHIILCLLLAAIQATAQTVTGDWTLQYGDSKSSGKLTFHLTENDKKIMGTYEGANGRSGLIDGNHEGDNLNLAMAETSSDCPGTYTLTAHMTEDDGSGQFSGNDCAGQHTGGVLSLKRLSAAAPPVAHDQDGNVIPLFPLYVYGNPFRVAPSKKALVSVAVEEVDGYLQLEIAIRNSSDLPVTFFPEKVTAYDENAEKPLKYYTANEVAKKIRRRAAWATFFQAWGNGMQAAAAAQRNATGSVDVRDQYGNRYTGTYTADNQQPDWNKINQQNAQIGAANRRAAQRQIDALTRLDARTETIPTETNLMCTMLFARPKNLIMISPTGDKLKSYFVTIKVPLGDEIFKFRMPYQTDMWLAEQAKKAGIK
jgi:hypothetical protein